MANRYPRVEINLSHLKGNVKTIVDKCAGYGIQVAGVIKGATGLPEVAKSFEAGGVAFIASSRLEQLEDVKNAGVTKPLMSIRIPMLSEVSDLIRIADYSLESELEVLEALNLEAGKQGKLHKVVLMADLGDLREGFWDKDEIVRVAEKVENEMINLQLAGVGTNLGCYGSIVPTEDKLDELVEIAERIEKKIGRELEIISGGATSSYMRVMDGDIPKRINHLRIGEGILLARDYEVFYGYKNTGLYQDSFVIKAEVIEVKDKPSYPVGKIGVDAFGHSPEYVDRGMRKRALLALGKVDYGDPTELIPMDKGIEILGASSDHTILDIEDAEREFKIGDIVEFTVCYATIVYVTNCRNVNIVYK